MNEIDENDCAIVIFRCLVSFIIFRIIISKGNDAVTV